MRCTSPSLTMPLQLSALTGWMSCAALVWLSVDGALAVVAGDARKPERRVAGTAQAEGQSQSGLQASQQMCTSACTLKLEQSLLLCVVEGNGSS